MATEEWRILVEESTSGTSTSTSTSSGSSSGIPDAATKQIPKKQLNFFDQFGKYFKLFLPIIGTAGVIYALVRSSSVTSALLEGFMAVFNILVSTILAPLVPLFVSIMNLILAFLPVVQLLADLLKPLADAIAKLLDWVTKNIATPAIKSIVDTLKTGKVPGMTTEESNKLYEEIDKASKEANDKSLTFWQRMGKIFEAWSLSQLVPPSFYDPIKKQPLIPSIPDKQEKNKNSSGYTEVNNTFNIDLQTSGNVDTLVNEIERRVKLSLNMAYRRA